MTTYDFIIEHIDPALIPTMEKYINAWTEDDKDIHLEKKFSNDLSTVIYPYLAAYRALEEAGVKNPERIILELREKELM